MTSTHSERFYQELVAQARKVAEHARKEGKEAEATAVEAAIEEILKRPEHKWQSGKPLGEDAAE